MSACVCVIPMVQIDPFHRINAAHLAVESIHCEDTLQSGLTLTLTLMSPLAGVHVISVANTWGFFPPATLALTDGSFAQCVRCSAECID